MLPGVKWSAPGRQPPVPLPIPTPSAAPSAGPNPSQNPSTTTPIGNPAAPLPAPPVNGYEERTKKSCVPFYSIIGRPLFENAILSPWASPGLAMANAGGVPASKPPNWILPGQAIFDGDCISLSSNAWASTKHGITLKRMGNHIVGVPGDAAFTETKRSNPFTFVIRKVTLDPSSDNYYFKQKTLGKNREAIGWGEDQPFVLLCTTGSPAVMRTKLMDQTAFLAVNSNEAVMAEPFPVTSKEKREECTGAVLGLAKNGCINGKAQAVAVWYFSRPSRMNNESPSFGWSSGGVLIRNMYSVVHGNLNGGRNLTMAAGSGGTVVKTSGILNDDGDDKSIWYVGAYNGRVIPFANRLVPRFEGAPALSTCAYGQRINAQTLACEGEAVELSDRQKCEEENARIDAGLKFHTGRNAWERPAETATFESDLNAAVNPQSDLIASQVNPDSAFEKIFYSITGKRWQSLAFYERLGVKAALLASGIIVIASAGSVGYMVLDDYLKAKFAAESVPSHPI